MEIWNMTNKMLLVVFSGLFMLTSAAFSADTAVVIPLLKSKKIGNVVTVAKKGGDFTDPAAAMNAITDASAANPYLVVIAPGIYTLSDPLIMKEYVSVMGSGQGVTKLTGSISGDVEPSSAIVLGASNATLSSMTVENLGDNYYNIAIQSSNCSPTIVDVKAIAIGGENSFGIHNYPNASPVLRDVTALAAKASTSNFAIFNHTCPQVEMTDVQASASGGIFSYGVYNYQVQNSILTDVKVTATGGSNSSYGVENASSTLTMIDVTASAYGDNISRGFFNDSGSTAEMHHCILDGQGDIEGSGIYSLSDITSLKVHGSVIRGSTYSINATGDVQVGTSQLTNSVHGTGTFTCVHSYSNRFTELTDNCKVPLILP